MSKTNIKVTGPNSFIVIPGYKNSEILTSNDIKNSEAVAIFKYKEHARMFGNLMYEGHYTIKPLYLKYF